MKYAIGGIRKDEDVMDVSMEFEDDDPEIVSWWAVEIPLPTSPYLEFVILCWED